MKNWEKVIKSDAPIFLTAYEAPHMKIGKKCEKLGKIGKKSAPVAPDSNISIPYRQ